LEKSVCCDIPFLILIVKGSHTSYRQKINVPFYIELTSG